MAVLMLLDRRADVFLARRSGAEGFLVKPLDPQRVRAAVRALSVAKSTRTSPMSGHGARFEHRAR